MSTPSAATWSNEVPPSSITTTLPTPAGMPSAASRRPVVICTGSPMPVSAIRWRAASACTLVMPGTTEYSKSTFPRAAMRARTRSVPS